MFINLTPIVQATTAAWETLIYIASECQAWQIEARAPLGTEQGSKSSLFSPWRESLNSGNPKVHGLHVEGGWWSAVKKGFLILKIIF